MPDGLVRNPRRGTGCRRRGTDWVICSYNLIKFGASVMMDALRTHPVVIIGGLLQKNPFFVPPDELLLEIQERRERRPAGNRAGTKAE